MENNRFLKIMLIALLIINVGTISYMWVDKQHAPFPHGPNGGPPPRPDVFAYLSKELQLDDKQVQEYSALRDEHHHAMENIQQKGGQLRERFFDMIHASPVDSVAIKNMADSIAHTQEQIELTTFYHFQKVRAILRPDQQHHFDDIIQGTLKMMAPPRQGPPPGR